MKKFLIFTMGIVFSFPGVASTEEITDWDRFFLWNECERINLLVDELNEDAAAISLSKEAVEIAARSRLRSARLFSDDPSFNGFLHIRVVVAGPAFSINVALMKHMHDLASDMTGIARAWGAAAIAGTHGRDSGYILSAVSGKVDEFIDEYLRVNAEAC